MRNNTMSKIVAKGRALILTLFFAVAMLLGFVAKGTVNAKADVAVGDTTTTTMNTSPEDVEYGVWKQTASDTVCGKMEHTHTDDCYSYSCDHKNGHLSTCFETSTAK